MKYEMQREINKLVEKLEMDLSDSMPVDDNPFSVEVVGELEVESVAGPGPNSGARKLAVDGYYHTFYAVGRPVIVFHLPF